MPHFDGDLHGETMASAKGVEVASHPIVPVSLENFEPNGLTSDEARIRVEKDGPNATPDTSAHPLRNALTKFWAPVPWLLEAAIVLQLLLHKDLEAAVITGVLIFNAALAWFQEGRARQPSLL
jgi:magnesium-transporting ATPase (P-type)